MVILYVITFLLISIVILELSLLLLQISGLLASYEKTTCKSVTEVITYWSACNAWTNCWLKVPLLLPHYHGYLAHLPASWPRFSKCPPMSTISTVVYTAYTQFRWHQWKSSLRFWGLNFAIWDVIFCPLKYMTRYCSTSYRKYLSACRDFWWCLLPQFTPASPWLICLPDIKILSMDRWTDEYLLYAISIYMYFSILWKISRYHDIVYGQVNWWIFTICNINIWVL